MGNVFPKMNSIDSVIKQKEKRTIVRRTNKISKYKPTAKSSVDKTERKQPKDETSGLVPVLLSYYRVFSELSVSYYISQLGGYYIFNLCMQIYGLDIHGYEVIIDWKEFRPLVDTECSLEELFTYYTRLACSKVDVITLNVKGEINENDFQDPLSNGSLQRVGSLAKLLLKRPTIEAGNQLLCTVNGDVYKTTLLRGAFVDVVFQHMNIIRKKSTYSGVTERLASFYNTRDNFDAGLEDLYLRLAEAGFYLTTKNTIAQCFNCGGMIQINRSELDPWYEHAYWHYRCSYLREAKGSEYVDGIRRKLKDATDSIDTCTLRFKISPIKPEMPRYNPVIDNDDDYIDSEEEDWNDSEGSDYFSDSEDNFSD